MNLCVFSGRIGRDAKTREVNGKTVATYSIAIPVGWGENKRTIYVNCTHWNCSGLVPYLKKGVPVMVRGQYNDREYEKDGETKHFIECIVADFEFQRGKESEIPKDAPQEQQPAPKPKASEDIPYDDDIPF